MVSSCTFKGGLSKIPTGGGEELQAVDWVLVTGRLEELSSSSLLLLLVRCRLREELSSLTTATTGGLVVVVGTGSWLLSWDPFVVELLVAPGSCRSSCLVTSSSVVKLCLRGVALLIDIMTACGGDRLK